MVPIWPNRQAKYIVQYQGIPLGVHAVYGITLIGTDHEVFATVAPAPDALMEWAAMETHFWVKDNHFAMLLLQKKLKKYVMRSSRISRNWHMWHFSFLFDWSAHLERYNLLKTSLESVQWFQGYEQLNGSQNNRKQ